MWKRARLPVVKSPLACPADPSVSHYSMAAEQTSDFYSGFAKGESGPENVGVVDARWSSKKQNDPAGEPLIFAEAETSSVKARGVRRNATTEAISNPTARMSERL
jgi:hypothetical protein